MWYTKFNLKKRGGHILCPICKSKNEEQIFYSLDKVVCEECNSENVFIRTKNYIYVFAIEKAPDLFKVIYEELKTKTLKEAYFELLQTSEVFSDEFKNENPN
jgi:hypothetical protein